MKRFKNWLITNFLPRWAKETVLADNERLRRRNEKLEHQNRELRWRERKNYTPRCRDCSEWDKINKECSHWYGFHKNDYCSYWMRKEK